MDEKQHIIKILVATGLYPPEIGGPATYARMLEEKLPAHQVEVAVLPFGSVRHLPKVLRHIAFAYKVFMQSKDVDIIFALDPISVGLPSWLVCVLRRKVFMVRLGGDYAWEQGQQRFGLTEDLDTYTGNQKKAPMPVKILAALQGFVVRRAKKIIVPSEYLKRIVTTWGVRESQLEVIYSALFSLEVSDTKDALREQLGYSGVVITSVGRLVPWKGFEVLIDTIKMLRKKGREVTLVIAGDGPLNERLHQKIEKSGLQEYVRLVGRLSKDALGATIKASDVFVLNTAYEGLSHQLLEVMDLGVPVVTTDVGGNPEIIKDGVTGLMVPYNNMPELAMAVERFIDNPEFKNRLTQNARARTKDFSQEIVTGELVTVVSELVFKKK